ncbi:hypothetical protein HanIR_Chr04g0189251 [Helianthus annuus]|nr:hypothetical protein HanIR_Chr04g0189251 [Helianthus annuus]
MNDVGYAEFKCTTKRHRGGIVEDMFIYMSLSFKQFICFSLALVEVHLRSKPIDFNFYLCTYKDRLKSLFKCITSLDFRSSKPIADYLIREFSNIKLRTRVIY